MSIPVSSSVPSSVKLIETLRPVVKLTAGKFQLRYSGHRYVQINYHYDLLVHILQTGVAPARKAVRSTTEGFKQK